MDTLNKNSLNFSINRRISRPDYQLFNPFLFFEDNYSYSSGNPYLNPQYQYRYEIKFFHKQFFRTGLSYNKFTGSIFQGTKVEDDVFITMPVNFNGGYMLLWSTGISVAPSRWWNLNSDIHLSRINLHGKISSDHFFDLNLNIARININNQFSFSKGWSGELGGYYASRDFNGHMVTMGMFRANLGIQKSILNDNGRMSLNVEDIFGSWIFEQRSEDLNGAQVFQTLRSDTQRIGIAFTYRFGKDTFSRKSKHNNNASDEEKNRVNR